MEYKIGDKVIIKTHDLEGVVGEIVDIDNEWWNPYEVVYQHDGSDYSVLVSEYEINPFGYIYKEINESVKQVNKDKIVEMLEVINSVSEELNKLDDSLNDVRVKQAHIGLLQSMIWLNEVKDDETIWG